MRSQETVIPFILRIKSVTLPQSRNGKICLASLGGCSIVYDGMIIPLSMTHGHQRPAGPRFRVIPPLIWHRTHSRSCLNERSKFKYKGISYQTQIGQIQTKCQSSTLSLLRHVPIIGHILQRDTKAANIVTTKSIIKNCNG